MERERAGDAVEEQFELVVDLLNNFTEDLADATKAIELNSLLFESILRKDTALIKLEAKADLEAAASPAPAPAEQVLEHLNNDETSSARERLDAHIDVAKNFINRAYVTFFDEATKYEIETIRELGPQRADYIIAEREVSPFKNIKRMMKGEMKRAFETN